MLLEHCKRMFMKKKLKCCLSIANSIFFLSLTPLAQERHFSRRESKGKKIFSSNVHKLCLQNLLNIKDPQSLHHLLPSSSIPIFCFVPFIWLQDTAFQSRNQSNVLSQTQQQPIYLATIREQQQEGKRKTKGFEIVVFQNLKMELQKLKEKS